LDKDTVDHFIVCAIDNFEKFKMKIGKENSNFIDECIKILENELAKIRNETDEVLEHEYVIVLTPTKYALMKAREFEMKCYRCRKDFEIGQRVVSRATHSKHTHTKHYCIPCFVSLFH